MFKHMRYPHSRKSLSISSEDGSQKNSACSDNSSSRSSSALSLGEGHTTGVIKVHCSVLRPDVDYKTLFVSTFSTTRDIVQMLLQKCKMRNRDANLYYIDMEISMQYQSGQPLVTVLTLHDDAQPLDLKISQPSEYKVKFTLRSPGGRLLRVNDSCLNPNSKYKSLLVAPQTRAEEVIQMLLTCHDSMESSENFALFEVCHMPHYYELKLLPQELPLLVCDQWSDQSTCSLHLRRIVPQLSESETRLLPFIRRLALADRALQLQRVPEMESNDAQLAKRKEQYLSERPLTFLYGQDPFSPYENYVHI